jgi:flagellar hook-associated protein 1
MAATVPSPRRHRHSGPLVMSNLFASLGVSARALEAQQLGLEITGQNIANAATPGYARRRVVFAESPGADGLVGRGVTVEGIESLRDMLLERRLRDERPGAGREAAIAESLAIVETALGSTSHGLDASMASFFNAFSELATDPMSAAARQGVVLAGETVANHFHAITRDLAAAQRHTDGQLRAAVDDVNALTEQIASLNTSIRGAEAGSAMAAGLQDQLHLRLHELSELVDIDVIPHANGSVDVTFGAGRPLVLGNGARAITATSGPPSGYASLSIDGVNVTSEFTSGRVGGLLQVRDTLVPQYQSQLDTLANAFVDEVNTLHAAGFDGAGNPADEFFSPLAAVAGSAAAIAVRPAVVANPTLVAAATVAIVGDNQMATAIAALRDTIAVSGSFTFAEAWGDIAYSVGRDAQTARQEQQSRDGIVRSMETLRDSVSGVSLDEEALKLMQFQRAYEANARAFRAIDEALMTLFNMVGR